MASVSSEEPEILWDEPVKHIVSLIGEDSGTRTKSDNSFGKQLSYELTVVDIAPREAEAQDFQLMLFFIIYLGAMNLQKLNTNKIYN